MLSDWNLLQLEKLHVLSSVVVFFAIVASVRITYLKYEIVLFLLPAYISENKPWILLFNNTFYEFYTKLLLLIESFHGMRTWKL